MAPVKKNQKIKLESPWIYQLQQTETAHQLIQKVKM